MDERRLADARGSDDPADVVAAAARDGEQPPGEPSQEEIQAEARLAAPDAGLSGEGGGIGADATIDQNPNTMAAENAPGEDGARLRAASYDE